MQKKMKESDLLYDVKKRARKAGKPPGTLTYTGAASTKYPIVTLITYSETNYTESTDKDLPKSFQLKDVEGVVWVNIEGLHNLDIIRNVAKIFSLHPLTVEDILNVGQRPKVEEFDKYIYISMKAFLLEPNQPNFTIKQLSIVVGEKFVLSFQEMDTTLFDGINARLAKTAHQRLRQQGSDFLAYRLIDHVVDQYFVILENVGEKIEETEDHIISSPSPETARHIYQLKRQMLTLRKSIWPMRETIAHLVHLDNQIFTEFTKLYFRDVYDHTIQSIDTMETFRDILSSMLDMYLSSLTNRMNEIMKTLTIITTIFIPITSIASIYGMNFSNMPGLHWRFGFSIVIIMMLLIAVGMIFYFRKRKWI